VSSPNAIGRLLHSSVISKCNRSVISGDWYWMQ